MIPNVFWPELPLGKLRSPFMRGKEERPLSLTLHVQSLRKLSKEETVAYEAIRELGQLSLTDVQSTGDDTFPFWCFFPDVDKDGYLHIKVLRNGAEPSLHHGAHLNPQDRKKSIIDLSNDDAFLARSHIALRRDIFITSSPFLLGCRDKYRSANIQTPLEAAQLVGLFLRSRENWTYRHVGKCTCLTSRHTFYWVLSRFKLPAMWRYFSACVSASKILGEEILYVGQSILERSSRALQARDAVGIQSYLQQDYSTGDEMMYHFDYLTLLLAGIFDAQAKIASMVYGIPGEGLGLSFRNKRFVKALHRLAPKAACIFSEKG